MVVNSLNMINDVHGDASACCPNLGKSAVFHSLFFRDTSKMLIIQHEI